MGSQRISNPWGEEGAQQLHLLRSNLIVDCRSRRSRLAFKRFHPEYCNLRANPSIPAKLSTFVPFCPPLGVILSTSVLPSSFLPNSPSPSYDAPFVHCVGIISRHRLSEPPHPSSPTLSPFLRPPSFVLSPPV